MEQVTLTEKEFNDLPEYSCSIPTGKIIGKKWKRGEPYGRAKRWYLCEYVECVPYNPKKVCIKYKRIAGILRIKKL